MSLPPNIPQRARVMESLKDPLLNTALSSFTFVEGEPAWRGQEHI